MIFAIISLFMVVVICTMFAIAISCRFNDNKMESNVMFGYTIVYVIFLIYLLKMMGIF